MKRKVLFITPFLMQGGVEHSLITALSGLDYNLFDVTLYLYEDELTLLSDVPPPVHVKIGIDNTHYYRYPYSIILYAFSKISSVLHCKNAQSYFNNLLSNYIHKKKVFYPWRRFFSKEHFDVVISYCLHLGTEMALTISAEKHFLFLHNSHTEYHADIFERCMTKYDSIFAVNSLVRDIYVKSYPQLIYKLFILENYIDVNKIITLSKDKMDSSIILDKEWIIATCGRMSSEKGFDMAVGAADYLYKQGVSFIWLFIGDGDDRNMIERLIDKKLLGNQIIITGYKNNPFPYMASCKIYVQPSYEEAQPLVLLEAMALGKPIVSTKTVGGKSILDEGKKGVLTDFSSESIAKGILSLINSSEKRSTFENLYSIEDDQRNRQIYYDKWKKILL